MKYTKFILFFLAIFMVSCSIDDDFGKTKNDGGKVHFVGRVVPFSQYDVNTRASIEEIGEGTITCLDYIVLAKSSTSSTEYDKCIFYRHSPDPDVENDEANTIITIDIANDFKPLVDSGYGAMLDDCKVIVLANYTQLYQSIREQTLAKAYNDNSYYKEGTSILDVQKYIKDFIVFTGDETDETGYVGESYFEYIKQPVYAIVGIPRYGLPRMGVYKNPDGTSNINFNDIATGKTYEVHLESLYAKMVFDIQVKPTQALDDEVYGNVFKLNKFTITNLAAEVDMISGTPSEEGDNQGSYDDDIVINDTIAVELIPADSTSVLISSRRNRFSCYIPERYTPAMHKANGYSYEFLDADINRADDIELLRQRYKPLLAEGRDATYVTFSGVFTNHQGHEFIVSYDIYVGNDNYSNFDIVRNRQYNNNITIRGLDNYLGQSSDENAVSIDHRVNVELNDSSSSAMISLRRETFLDSHFEVRPMRIRKNPKHPLAIPSGAKHAVKVDVVFDDPQEDWIGIEQSFGGYTESDPEYADYCTGQTGEGYLGASSAGKRKYFTTDLTTNTLKGKSVVVTVPDNENESECVWIYVDECDSESEASENLNATRDARIKVTHGYIVGNAFTASGKVDEYYLVQHLLYKVVTDSATYYIEHEEEYLYNFDAEDTYSQNLTQSEGMPWGLNNVTISNEHRALFVKGIGVLGSGFSSIIQWIVGFLSPYYDFYLSGDSDKDVDVHYRKDGHGVFCPKIVTRGQIGRLTLEQHPQSAVEYCYNRNKRNSDGTVASADWYLPNILEIQDIVTNAYADFDDFQNKFYWSCQPAYIRNYYYYNVGAKAHGEYMIENKNYARATKYDYNALGEKYAHSGMVGYNVLKTQTGLSEDGDNDTPTPTRLQIDTWTEDLDMEIPKGTYEEGYKLRTSKCRVRAVRKMN